MPSTTEEIKEESEQRTVYGLGNVLISLAKVAVVCLFKFFVRKKCGQK